MLENIHKSDPEQIMSCGIQGPKSIMTTPGVCYAAMKFFHDNSIKLKPYAGYNLLQQCGLMKRYLCLALIEEMSKLAGLTQSKPPFALMKQCANDFEEKFTGGEKAQYWNVCRGLTEYFR